MQSKSPTGLVSRTRRERSSSGRAAARGHASRGQPRSAGDAPRPRREPRCPPLRQGGAAPGSNWPRHARPRPEAGGRCAERGWEEGAPCRNRCLKRRLATPALTSRPRQTSASASGPPHSEQLHLQPPRLAGAHCPPAAGGQGRCRERWPGPLPTVDTDGNLVSWFCTKQPEGGRAAAQPQTQ